MSNGTQLTLFQLARSWSLPNPSHFCCKTETYFRIVGIDYAIHNTYPLFAPSKKLPYINDNGVIVTDSRLITRYLQERYGYSPDSWLNSKQLAFASALQRLVEEHLYWISMYYRCMYSPENWWATQRAIAGPLPWGVREAIAMAYRNRFRRQVIAQGIGRLKSDDVFLLGQQDINTIAEYLADKPYILGESPSSLDATVFGFLSNLICVPIESPLKSYALEHSALTTYCHRMMAQYFPELQTGKS